jgi:hypothetical protein
MIEAPWCTIVVVIALGLGHILQLEGIRSDFEYELDRKVPGHGTTDPLECIEYLYDGRVDVTKKPKHLAGFHPCPDPQAAE